MENRKNEEDLWYEWNFALMKNGSERRFVKRMWDKNLLNSKRVNTIYAIVLSLGLFYGISQSYLSKLDERSSLIYENVENKTKKTYLDDLLTIIPW